MIVLDNSTVKLIRSNDCSSMENKEDLSAL